MESKWDKVNTHRNTFLVPCGRFHPFSFVIAENDKARGRAGEPSHS